jgi:hypothetical protein
VQELHLQPVAAPTPFVGTLNDIVSQMTFEQQLPNGVTRTALATQVFASQEYVQDLGESFYQRILDRAADPSGLAYFTSQLQMGATDQQVIAAIVGSVEYLSRLGR